MGTFLIEVDLFSATKQRATWLLEASWAAGFSNYSPPRFTLWISYSKLRGSEKVWLNPFDP